MAVNYKVYQSNHKGSANGKFYGRVAYRDTVTIKELAQTMQDNCTVKYSDIMAVLTELSGVLKAELLRGNRVKIDGLGTFKIGMSTYPADTASEFTAANIKETHVLFQPESSKDANGKRTKALLAGICVKEASVYESPKDAEKDAEKAQDGE